MSPFTTFMLALPSLAIASALTLTTPSLILPASTITNATNTYYTYQCNGRQLGRDLNSRSCNEALSQIDISSTAVQTYGYRFRGSYDVNLPRRYISRSF